MISKIKDQLAYKYDKPINWNIACFGNEYQMFIIDNLLDIFSKYNIENPIKTIHGSYSNKYNGGRTALYFNSWTNIENKIKHYNDLGVGIKLTFSNRHVHKEQFEEKEMRQYLDLLNETKGIGNGIICVNDDFAELVKKNYPDLDLVSSHVKIELETQMGITDTPDYYNSKFDLYDIVVVNTYRAFDDEFLDKIKYKDRIEFIVNRSCRANCQLARRHHELIDDLQEKKVELNHDGKKIDMNKEVFNLRMEIQNLLKICTQNTKMNTYDKICTQFINQEEINHLLSLGINRFKLEGRDQPSAEFLTYLNRYIINNQSAYLFINEKYEDNIGQVMKNTSRRFLY